jgi:hypothetical protein
VAKTRSVVGFIRAEIRGARCVQVGAAARAANLQAVGQKEEGWRAKEEREGELILTYIYEDDVSSESFSFL